MHGHVLFEGLTFTAVLAAAACTDDVGPTVGERFAASLSGANEIPAVTTTATASAQFEVLNGVPGVYFTLTVTGIDSVTAAHIHGPADGTQSAGVIVPLYAGTTGPGISGTLAQGGISSAIGITFDSLLVLLRTGNAYVNVHTKKNPGGEIRGQVTKQ